MKYANVISGRIVTVSSAINAECTVVVPDDAEPGDTWDGATLTKDDAPRIAAIEAGASAQIDAEIPPALREQLQTLALVRLTEGQRVIIAHLLSPSDASLSALRAQDATLAALLALPHAARAKAIRDHAEALKMDEEKPSWTNLA